MQRAGRIAAGEPHHVLALLGELVISASTSSRWPERRKPLWLTKSLRASRRAKSSTSCDTRSSNRMTSANCSARTARSVSKSASRGPASTTVTDPYSAAAPLPFGLGEQTIEVRLAWLAVGMPHRMGGKALPEFAARGITQT